LQRYHNRLWANHRTHRLGRFWNLPGFDAYQDYIDYPNLRRIISCVRRLHNEIALDAIHP
jgi:hypothetical protein